MNFSEPLNYKWWPENAELVSKLSILLNEGWAAHNEQHCFLDKTRNIVEAGRHIYEVDEFYGENEGLTLAEIELSSENEEFIKPDWLGEEVTGDPKYYNSMLIKKPYTKW